MTRTAHSSGCCGTCSCYGAVALHSQSHTATRLRLCANMPYAACGTRGKLNRRVRCRSQRFNNIVYGSGWRWPGDNGSGQWQPVAGTGMLPLPSACTACSVPCISGAVQLGFNPHWDLSSPHKQLGCSGKPSRAGEAGQLHTAYSRRLPVMLPV